MFCSHFRCEAFWIGIIPATLTEPAGHRLETVMTICVESKCQKGKLAERLGTGERSEPRLSKLLCLPWSPQLPSCSRACGLPHAKMFALRGAWGVLSRLGVWLLITAPGLISGSWVQALHWAPHWACSLLKTNKQTNKNLAWHGNIAVMPVLKNSLGAISTHFILTISRFYQSLFGHQLFEDQKSWKKLRTNQTSFFKQTQKLSNIHFLLW